MQHFESILFFSRFHARHDLRRRDGGRGRPAALHSGQPADGRARRTQPLPLHVSDTSYNIRGRSRDRNETVRQMEEVGTGTAFIIYPHLLYLLH